MKVFFTFGVNVDIYSSFYIFPLIIIIYFFVIIEHHSVDQNDHDHICFKFIILNANILVFTIIK